MSGGNEEPGSTDGQSEPKEAKTLDLTPESGVQYVRAMQGFSPEFEQWVLNREKSEVTYKRVNCLGEGEGLGAGTVGWTDAMGDQSASVEITWDGESPMDIGQAPTVEYEISDRQLVVSVTEAASARTDIEVERFKNICAETGQAIAGLVL
ncbi:hypothetical protein ASF74_16590 [Arthrobacter sp. Leaf145]|nr:hypothetical protein ASF74_16590 [Arthrobacter sp. Leaf145]